MIGLLQRVTKAAVVVDEESVGAIDAGLLVLIGVEKDDDEAQADKLLQRLLGYRVFADEEGRMNLSLQDVAGGLLLVPQFTLAADTGRASVLASVLQLHLCKGNSCLIIYCNGRKWNTQAFNLAGLVRICR